MTDMVYLILMTVEYRTERLCKDTCRCRGDAWHQQNADKHPRGNRQPGRGWLDLGESC